MNHRRHSWKLVDRLRVGDELGLPLVDGRWIIGRVVRCFEGGGLIRIRLFLPASVTFPPEFLPTDAIAEATVAGGGVACGDWPVNPRSPSLAGPQADAGAADLGRLEAGLHHISSPLAEHLANALVGLAVWYTEDSTVPLDRYLLPGRPRPIEAWTEADRPTRGKRP